jgi:hypothetical protein
VTLSIMESLAERLNREPELTRLISVILDRQLPDGLMDKIRATLREIVDETPHAAWTYIDASDNLFLAQAKTFEEALDIIEEDTGYMLFPGELQRCEAMDGLGHNFLYGLYSGTADEVPCAEYDACGTAIIVQDSHLVNKDTLGDAIVVGDVLYCSRFCADQAR